MISILISLFIFDKFELRKSTRHERNTTHIKLYSLYLSLRVHPSLINIYHITSASHHCHNKIIQSNSIQSKFPSHPIPSLFLYSYCTHFQYHYNQFNFVHFPSHSHTTAYNYTTDSRYHSIPISE